VAGVRGESYVKSSVPVEWVSYSSVVDLRSALSVSRDFDVEKNSPTSFGAEVLSFTENIRALLTLRRPASPFCSRNVIQYN